MTPETLAAHRHEWRKSRIALRKSMPADARAAADARLDAGLRALLRSIEGGCLGFYWPIQAEFDATPAVTDWLAQGSGRRAALPVVLARERPLAFREWFPASQMQAAGFGTFVPSAGEWLVPTVLVIPLVGYDDAGYRLGYGGGYYDRTLAAITPRPRSIGIGYASGHIDSIDPQSYDLKLDAVMAG